MKNGHENHRDCSDRGSCRLHCWRALSGAGIESGRGLMSQTSIIFGALFVGFLVFIVTKGEVATYRKILMGE